MNYLKLEIYSIISFVVIAALLIFFKKVIKGKKAAFWVFRIASILTILVHFSVKVIDLIETGTAYWSDNYVLAPYPCNVVMWICFVLCFFEDDSSRMFKLLSEFVALGGTLCGFFGTILNPDFLGTPTILEWSSFKAVLSHNIMTFSTLWLIVSGFVKISALRNLVSNLFGCCILIFCGLHSRLVDYMFMSYYPDAGVEFKNAMYLFKPPFDSMPWATFPVMVLLGATTLFVGINIYEFIARKPVDRWYKQKRLGVVYREVEPTL